MRVSSRSVLVSAMGLFPVAAALPAGAQVTEYTNRFVFNAAAPSLTTFTFDGYTGPNTGGPGPPYNYTQYPQGLAIQGVAFTSPDPSLYVIDPHGGLGNPFGGHQWFYGAYYIDITPPPGTTAFGLDFTSFIGSGIVNITADGQTFDLSANDGSTTSTPTFVGFISQTPLTGLRIYNPQTEGLDLDNISFGPAAVPEASTTVSFGLLLALGVGGAVIAARKKKLAV